MSIVQFEVSLEIYLYLLDQVFISRFAD